MASLHPWHRLSVRSVRLRVRYPGAGAESRDLYAKVVGVEAGDGVHRARVHLTSVDAVDRRAIESLITRV
ncbi:MAG: hypothetical protein ACHQ8D_10195 [Candidatus Rokuibacteriota bacterium]|jgi:hypothetical protein